MKQFILLLSCLTMTVANASAMGKAHAPNPGASPSPSPSSSDVIEMSPDKLREYVMSGNLSIEQELLNVYEAKDNRINTLTHLLPSVNLGAVLGSTTSGPGFLLSSVTFLLPFLVPDNWINLAESEHTLNAEEASYLVLELNQYASAYSLYEAVVNDYDALDVLQENYDTLYQLYLTLAMENQETGSVSITDVKNALEKAELADGPLIDMQKVIDIDVAALKQAMGIGFTNDKTLKFTQRVHVPASDAETLDPATISKTALAVAPEGVQLSEVLAAAENAKWGAIFGFITGNTLGSLPNTGGTGPKSADLSNLVSQTQVSVGFGMAPTIQLTNDNIDNVKNQQELLGLQLDFIAETSLKTLKASAAELDTYKAAEDDAYEVYLSKVRSYSTGTTNLLDVLQAHTDYFLASGQRVQAVAALDSVRITLHRTLRTDQFSKDKIQGCGQNVPLKGGDSGIFGWFWDIFHTSSDRVTLDQMCKGAAPKALL